MRKSLLAIAVVATGFVASASTVTNLIVHSAKMDKDVPVSVVLPDAYDGTTRFPSVYVLHGAGGSNKKAENPVILSLVDRYGFIAIAPDGGKTSWWLDSPIDPKYQYETFVIDELLPFADANFRTIANRWNRGIMGGSMGGHGACYLGMRHKNLFGVIGNIYGGVDLVPWASNWDIAKRLGSRDGNIRRWEDHSVVNIAKTLKNGEVDLICALGTEDFFLGCNRQLHEILSANGVAHTYVEVRSPTTLQSVHGKFYDQGAEICLRFIANYFRDGYGHLGDVQLRNPRTENLYISHVHRGGGKLERPDNTLETFKWCWENGSALECDCRRTKDGIGIMLHDKTLQRTGRGISEEMGKRLVSEELTWDEIKDIDVGSYLNSQFAHHRIPTIEETFAAMKGHPTYLCFVDEKGAGPEYIAKKAIEAGVQDQVYYTGPSHEKIFEWQKILPGGKAMIWLGAWPKDHGAAERARADKWFRDAMAKLRAKDFKYIDVVSIHSYYDPTDPVDPFVPSTPLLKEMVEEFHAHGIKVASIPFQGGETEEVYFKLHELGFDAFSTDYPSVMFKVIKELKERK